MTQILFANCEQDLLILSKTIYLLAQLKLLTMKIYIIFAFIALYLNVNAQITLVHVYDSASTYNIFGPYAEMNQLMLIKFEISGERYIKINRWGKYIRIYNLNHVLLKKISISSFPTNANGQLGDFLYFSEQLFNTDSSIECMYTYGNTSTNDFSTQIYNEDGIILFSDTGAPKIRGNFEQQQYPIYNTSQGSIMILSYKNGPAKVFSLPGTLTTSIQESNNNLIAVQTQSSVSNAYPNPTYNSAQIDYTLPEGINEGEIVFYDLMGNEVKRFKVDKTFNTLLVSTADIAAGTYYYQLQTTAENSEGKKMVLIK